MNTYHAYKFMRMLGLISKTEFKEKYSNEYAIVAKSDLFDTEWYLEQNPDVKNAKIDPVLHYINYGWKEGRNPSSQFNGNDYLEYNTDVKLAKINPLVHYETSGKSEGRIKNLLVHLHLFYIDQIDYFLDKLRNITVDYDLFVTYVQEDSSVISKIKAFKSDAHVMKVENGGYDVYPFWQVLQLVDLRKYRYVLKIHTKNYYKKFWKFKDILYTKYQWRDDLVNCLIGNKFIFKNNLKKLNNPAVGLVGCKNLIRKFEFLPQIPNTKKLCSILGIKYSQAPFIAGTCFFIKSPILKKFQKARFSSKDFVSKNKTGDGCSLAHSCETVFGVLTQDCGYKVRGTHTVATFIKSFKRAVNKKFRKNNQADKYFQDKNTLYQSSYFDASWYLKENSDVKKARKDPAEHYLTDGWKEGRNPSPTFSNEEYFRANPDVKRAGLCPLLHYELFGKNEGRLIRLPNSKAIDHAAAPHDDESNLNAIRQSQYFDSAWYLKENTDVKDAGIDPAKHYLKDGWKEGRNPGPTFSNEEYFRANPDVKKAGLCPLLHYELFGKNEGRLIKSPNARVLDNASALHDDESSLNAIRQSQYFDSAWYLKENTDVKDARIDPAKHYLKDGWKEGRNPSSKFDNEEYFRANPDVKRAGLCPLLHYEFFGKKEGRSIRLADNRCPDCSEASLAQIADYWKNHHKNNKVIYTCLVGEYDHLINHHCIANDYDYVCFTDNPELLEFKTYGVWDIRPLVFTKLDSTRNNRWHKLHPHELFPEYEVSVYIDSNINILTDYIFRKLKNTKKNLVLPMHFQNNCIYEELKFIVKCHKDSAQNINVLRDFYTNQKLPHNFGFSENNLIYRKHHDKNIIKTMHMWWDMIVRYSKRDQASLAYVMWKNHIDIKSHLIPNLRKDEKNFQFTKHKTFQNAYSLMQIQKYKKLIDEHKIISFDIFDTLLVRPYLKPSDLFLHLETTENKPGFAKARIKAERDIRSVGDYDGDITLDMIYSHINDEFKNLQEKEKEFELQVCQQHPVIKQLYDYALEQGKKVIIISDMYLSRQFLVNLLNKNGYQKFQDIFVSCEEHASKRDGSLYKAVLDKMKCLPADILHIGDNPVVDGEKATEHNIHNLIIEKASEHLFKINPKAELLSQKYTNKLELSLYLGILAINSISAREYISQQTYYENLGYEYGGVAAYQFVKFIYSSCLKNNIKDIAMVARDGYTLQRVFNLFNKCGLNSHYVYAPRSISNIISLKYNPDSSEQVESFAGYYREALFNEKVLPDTYSYEDNLKFIEDNKANIKEFAQKKETEYLKYLSQFNYTSSKLAIVDLATIWYTSQKLFEKIYPEKEVTGYYWRINSKNLFDKNAFDIKGESLGVLVPWDFMEFLFTAPEFPIKDLVDGKPVYKNTDNEYEQFRVCNYPYVSDGIVRFVKDVKKIFGDTDLNIGPLMVAELVKTLRQNPTSADIKFMKKLCYASDVSHSKYKPMFRSW